MTRASVPVDHSAHPAVSGNKVSLTGLRHSWEAQEQDSRKDEFIANPVVKMTTDGDMVFLPLLRHTVDGELV